MSKFWKSSLWPGTHPTSNGMKTFTPEDIEQAYQTTRQMLAEDITPPLLYEHPSITSGEGKPKPKRELKAHQAKNTAGWMAGSRMKDGILQLLFDVPDPSDAERIRSGQAKFVSPELLKTWRGKFKNAITHVAITSKPMNWKQTGFEEEIALQMSEAEPDEAFYVANAEDYQMADQTDTGNSPSNDQMESGQKPAQNPDLAATDKGDQKLEAVLELLRTACGIDLPADTDLGSLLDGLLTGLKTKALHDQAKKTEEAADRGEGDDRPTEENPGVQMSDQENATLSSLRNQLIAERAKSIQGSLDGIKSKIAPPLYQHLTEACNGIQMSDAGEEEPSIRVSELIEWLGETTTPGDLTAQMSDASESEHPEGDAFVEGKGANDEPSDEETQAIIDKQTKHGTYLGESMIAAGGR